MKINLPARWKDVANISEDERLTRRALDQDEDDTVYTYNPITIDTGDIRNWNDSGDNHTTIRTYEGDAYSISLPHEEFDKLWTQITGESIIDVRVREKKEKITRR